MNRRKALFFSLALTVALNTFAGILTLAYANGITIVETNPLSRFLLADLGPISILAHDVEIALVYSLAYALSAAVSSKRPIFRVKRIYLFTFLLLIAVLPAAAFADPLSDFLVVFFHNDMLAGPQKAVAITLAFTIPFSTLLVWRRWTLATVAGQEVRATSASPSASY